MSDDVKELVNRDPVRHVMEAAKENLGVCSGSLTVVRNDGGGCVMNS